MDFNKEDKIISEFLKSIGPWSAYIVIGGGYAPIVYKVYFSDRNTGNPPVGTRDIDTLIPRRIPQISINSIAKNLKNAGFDHQFKDRDNPATESYTKMIEDIEVEIEFLTDNLARYNRDKNVLVSGVSAQALSYLKLSLENNLSFNTSSGQKGFVVSPEAWMFHKGLTFTKRKSKLKLYKDLYGIWYVGTQLGEFSEESLDRLKALFLEKPKWYETFKKNLIQWEEEAAPIDWSTLESQDPFGKLKELNFQRLLKKLLV